MNIHTVIHRLSWWHGDCKRGVMPLGLPALREAHVHLAGLGIAAPAGSFYAYEPFRALGLPEAALRIGLAPYNTHDDVDRLLAGLDDFLDG